MQRRDWEKDEGYVPRRGLEPPQGYPHRYLKPACLPFHHLGKGYEL